MAEIFAPQGVPLGIDERTVSTGHLALYADLFRLQQGLASAWGAPYEQGNAMLGRKGTYRLFDSGTEDLSIPLRRSPCCRDLLVKIKADGEEGVEGVLQVAYGSVSETIPIVGTDAESHDGLEWISVVLFGIGDGTVETHDKTSTQPTNDLVLSHSSGGDVWLYNVAWRELHNERIVDE